MLSHIPNNGIIDNLRDRGIPALRFFIRAGQTHPYREVRKGFEYIYEEPALPVQGSSIWSIAKEET